MAQNITLMGASYSDVPSVALPKTGGGTASFTDVTDTTATASDVASGKYFYLASGEKVQGSSTGGGGYVWQDQDGYVHLSPSGGVLSLDSLSVTENGTYTPATGHAYSSVEVEVSGGASNFVSGTFTTGTTEGVAESISIPYTGSGYPVIVNIYFASGWNSNSSGYSTIHQYAIIQQTLSRVYPNSSPNYAGAGGLDQSAVVTFYKSSASNGAVTSTARSNGYAVYNNTDATGASESAAVFIKSATSLSYFISSTSYGLLANTTYRYDIVYSE